MRQFEISRKQNIENYPTYEAHMFSSACINTGKWDWSIPWSKDKNMRSLG